jgi:hypothetical protein
MTHQTSPNAKNAFGQRVRNRVKDVMLSEIGDASRKNPANDRHRVVKVADGEK